MVHYVVIFIKQTNCLSYANYLAKPHFDNMCIVQILLLLDETEFISGLKLSI